MNIGQILLLVIALLLVILWLFRVIIEPTYVYIFKKPLYIHWYPFPKNLSFDQRQILEKEFVFYQKLSEKRKKYFEYRVASFIHRYQFDGKAHFIVTDHTKILIAAPAVMLTFGMRRYLIDVFDTIIIYPKVYFSTITQEFHKGEFNPRLKTLVFSWEDFQQGFQLEADNLNLGLHEFAHALHFHGLKGRDQSSIVFSDGYVNIKEYLVRPNVLKLLVASNYFRIYAYTNQMEFLAVILEHFFETPQVFKKELPELFEKVRMMINFNE
ncbi:zinc-dependent peptidase [Flavobacterium sp. GT3R68]|uniref:zinc-dependent peptidase n=1 Tax=Flavobacterium sp. GT3R68 TaxID=2594437 RepID=UPI000F85D22C|nr:zinc-dependent peptidase [Flavobacterium sp. GT3R68]RTY90919.1 hypothetical protein EKL32_19870 [Flavobacterium sp. GSN2]TRW90482.1 zinc-dependent peptidase [Flavobacterium sp. GT3R68]